MPMHMMNGTKRIYPPMYNYRHVPFYGPRGMPPGVPFVGGFRGPPPRPMMNYGGPHRYPPPMMMHPHFFRPPYPQVIYEYESDDDGPRSQRSTIRQHRERYHGSFFGVPNTSLAPKMVIK